MSDPSLALQAAIKARLSRPALSCPIYDSVPPEAAPPYVTIDSEIASNTTPISGWQRASRMLYLSVWSNYAGQCEVKQIMSEIYDALSRDPLVLLTDGRAFGVRVERMSTNRDADGVTFMGGVSLRVLTQQNPRATIEPA